VYHKSLLSNILYQQQLASGSFGQKKTRQDQGPTQSSKTNRDTTISYSVPLKRQVFELDEQQKTAKRKTAQSIKATDKLGYL